MATPLLRTKLYIPPPPPDLVPRPHLIQQLDAGLYRKLTLISAPAGFGKTTLVSEWAACSNRLPRVAWISLDEEDNDPARFVAYVVAALQTIEGRIGEEASRALQSPQQPPLQEILIALVNQIDAVSPATGPPDCPFVLVLDDYHLITAQAIHAAVSFLLDHLPPQMHLVIVARSDPPLALARLRGRGQLTEVRLNDLRFTPGEANQLLHDVTGLELATDDIVTLSSRTEGWIAGLQMAALALQSQRQPEATSADPEWDARRATDFIRSFAGSDRYILDYLAEEVLQHQPDSVQDFLLQTAILDRLTAPLCDAVCFGEPETDTSRTNGRSMLERLERTNLFIIPLDNERRWYRYHRLFVDLLRSRLYETQPDLAPILHRRASQWYEHRALFHGEDGLMAAAISHALSAQDFERAADLTEQIAKATLMRSEVTTLLRWVEMLPEEMVRARSSLCLYHAWALLLSGRPVAEIEARLEDIDEAADLSPGAAVPLRAWVAAFQGQLSQATELARQALHQLPQDELFLRNIAAWILGASLASEDLVSGSRALAEVARISQVHGNLMVAVAALSQSAEQHMRQGQLHRAKAIYEQALALAVDDQGHWLPAAGAALMGLGELAREWNDLEAARRYLLEGIDLSEKWSEVGAFDGYITLAHVRQAAGNLEGARDALDKAQRIAVQFDATELDDLAVAMYQARLRLWQGDISAAMRWAKERMLEAKVNVPELAENGDSIAHRLRKYELVVLARLWLSQGRFDDAQALLEQLLPLMEKRGRKWTAIEIRILMALALAAKGELDRAQIVLGHALSSAEPEGYVRVFVDEGPSMAQLLYGTAARGIAPQYVGKILAAFDLEITAKGRESTQQPSALIEPLSKRELEVLQLLAEGLSNREIAGQLVISLSTVKGHTANIYGKLAVKSRMQAVTRARTLGILDSM